MADRRRTEAHLEELLARKRTLAERLRGDAALERRLRELRLWQAARLAGTYADLKRDPTYAEAVDFFLDDLYGPEPFARRDGELLRAWSILRHTLPGPALEALDGAIELEVLTHELDARVAEVLGAGPVTAASYAEAYRAAGGEADRRRQIELVVEIGRQLDRIVRQAWLALALRAARAPAHAAGFGALQDFLERGFAAFRHMPETAPFLRIIRERETRLMQSLFAAEPGALASAGPGGGS